MYPEGFSPARSTAAFVTRDTAAPSNALVPTVVPRAIFLGTFALSVKVLRNPTSTDEGSGCN